MLAQMAAFISTPQNLAEQRGALLDAPATEGFILPGPTGGDDNVQAVPVNAKMADTTLTAHRWQLGRQTVFALPYVARCQIVSCSPAGEPPHADAPAARTTVPSPPGTKSAHDH